MTDTLAALLLSPLGVVLIVVFLAVAIAADRAGS